MVEVAAPLCIHHWLLSEPNGAPTVYGICLYCKATAEFPVAMPQTSAWYRAMHEGDYMAFAEVERDRWCSDNRLS